MTKTNSNPMSINPTTINTIATNNIKAQAVLFDLDGTLVDTAKDFVRIIHEMAQENNWQAPHEDIIREHVSAGSQAMVSLFRLGNDSLKNEQILKLQQQFLERYEADICVDSCLFDGLDTLLNELECRQIPWGIVTNKPRYLSEKLLAKLGLTSRCNVLICPDDVTNAKPDPEPMYLAMEKMGLNQEVASQVDNVDNCILYNNVLYIGDHIRDIQAGNNAGMITVLASYGYISPDERINLQQWNADYTVDTSDGLADLVLGLIDYKVC